LENFLSQTTATADYINNAHLCKYNDEGGKMKKRLTSLRGKRKRIFGMIAAAFIIGVCIMSLFAITWGELDNDRHPNVGCILVDTLQWGTWMFGSCTLVDDNVVLTAGHVTAYLEYYISMGMWNVEDVKVSFDDDNVFNSATWNQAAAIVTHPEYYLPGSGASHLSHDIGAIILKEPMAIEPVTLADVGLLDDLKKDKELKGGPKANHLIAVGYGTWLEWPPPQILDSDGARYMAECGYQAANSQWLLCSQNKTLGLGGTGYGDSGGPAFWKLPDDSEVQVGITSWGDMTLVSTTWFYRVDTPEAIGFINDIIATANSLIN
jgi:hypothetical protein